jgi:hypothetical protein
MVSYCSEDVQSARCEFDGGPSSETQGRGE